MKCLFACLVIPCLAFPRSINAEIIDRVAITIGYQTITELEIDEELRVTALLNHKPVSEAHQPPDAASNEDEAALLSQTKARRDAADRLIQQFLIEREMQISRYPAPDQKELDDYAATIARDFGGTAVLNKAIADYHLDSVTLRRHLDVQLAVLRFIETRFRPEVSVSDAEVDAFLKEESRTDPLRPPKIDRDFVRQQITAKETDEALAVWLEEGRKRFDIIYLDKSLQ